MKEKKDEWLARLLATGRVERDDLEEIESHLDESMAELAELGLSANESFLVAADRMGHPVEIGEGFEEMGFLSSRVKIFLYFILGGIIVPLFSVLSGFLSGLFVFIGTHLGFVHYEDFQTLESVVGVALFGLLLTGGSWIILSRRSPVADWMLKVSASRWLLAVVFALCLTGSDLLTQGGMALRQLALREVTPSEHISHQPGSLVLSFNATELMFWVIMTIAIPWMVRKEKVNAGIL